MKILHCITSIDKDAGGTSTYLQSLANDLIKHISIEIATQQTKNPLPLNKDIKLFITPKSFIDSQGLSKDLKHYLNIIETDLFHGNGLWQYPVHAMATAARKRNIPYIISPHGMLEPWALNSGKWKKKLALKLFQFKDLAHASCIHATAKMEAENIYKFGFRNPIAVIPNGINLTEFPLTTKKKQNKKYTLIFLSRIHPKKGIELLIEAWSKLDKSLCSNWQLQIAGNGALEYIISLQQLIKNKKLENEILIIGPQFGNAKLKVYQNADLFVLPTYSENFGIVVAEALACGIPVITTKGTPWEELNTHNAGWWIDIGLEPLVEALKIAMRLSENERQLMGENGRQLVEKNYSIDSVAQKMILLYEWILNGGKKPDFIYN